MKFTIDRKTWLRGEGPLESYLLRRYDGKRCCLGFKAEACGYFLLDLADIHDPAGLLKQASAIINPGFERLLAGNSNANAKVTRDLIFANDNPVIEREGLRERVIQELFATIGDEVEFID